MPRFVILSHDWPFPHFDLMLESGDSLRTWRLRELPDRTKSMVLEQLADHRLDYLDYEGPVSGNRGTVTRWDWGAFKWENDLEREFTVQVTGNKLAGKLWLYWLKDNWWVGTFWFTSGVC